MRHEKSGQSKFARLHHYSFDNEQKKTQKRRSFITVT